MQAVDTLMPGFDKEIARLAQRLLINPRRIDYHTGVLATKVTPGMQKFWHASRFAHLLLIKYPHIVSRPSHLQQLNEQHALSSIIRCAA